MTGWLWLDPLVTLAIAIVIVASTWGLLRDSVAMSLAAVPAGIDPANVRALLSAQPGVSHVHDLHIWSMSTNEVALTAHLVIPSGHPGDGFLHDVAAELKAHHRIGHATLQIETDADACALAPDHVV
jgi:cobalt-zinc-cadmium efflux system protein